MSHRILSVLLIVAATAWSCAPKHVTFRTQRVPCSSSRVIYTNYGSGQEEVTVQAWDWCPGTNVFGEDGEEVGSRLICGDAESHLPDDPSKKAVITFSVPVGGAIDLYCEGAKSAPQHQCVYIITSAPPIWNVECGGSAVIYENLSKGQLDVWIQVEDRCVVNGQDTPSQLVIGQNSYPVPDGQAVAGTYTVNAGQVVALDCRGGAGGTGNCVYEIVVP